MIHGTFVMFGSIAGLMNWRSEARTRLLAVQAEQSRAEAALLASHEADRADHLRVLTDLNELVVSSLALEDVLREVAMSAARLLDASLVGFWIVDEREGELELRAFSSDESGLSQTVRRTRFGEGAAGWVAEHRAPLLIDDVLKDQRIGNLAWWTRTGLRSMLALPVLEDGRVVAVLAACGWQPFRPAPETQDIAVLVSRRDERVA